MSKTSAEVKNRYNAKAYDRISYSVKKGDKERYSQEAKKRGMSLNAFISMCVEQYIKHDGK